MMKFHSDKPEVIIWIYKLNKLQELYPLHYTESSNPVPTGTSIIELANKWAKDDNIVSVWLEWDRWNGDILVAKNAFGKGMQVFNLFSFDQTLKVHYS